MNQEHVAAVDKNSPPDKKWSRKPYGNKRRGRKATKAFPHVDQLRPTTKIPVSEVGGALEMYEHFRLPPPSSYILRGGDVQPIDPCWSPAVFYEFDRVQLVSCHRWINRPLGCFIGGVPIIYVIIELS